MAKQETDWNQQTQAYRIVHETRLSKGRAANRAASLLSSAKRYVEFQFLPHYWDKVPRWRVWVRSLGAERVFPDFICTGAIKSGTSDLSSYLFQHPCIPTPLAKEIASPNPRDWRPHYPTVREADRIKATHGAVRCGFFLPHMNNYPLI